MVGTSYSYGVYDVPYVPLPYRHFTHSIYEMKGERNRKQVNKLKITSRVSGGYAALRWSLYHHNKGPFIYYVIVDRGGGVSPIYYNIT